MASPFCAEKDSALHTGEGRLLTAREAGKPGFLWSGGDQAATAGSCEAVRVQAGPHEGASGQPEACPPGSRFAGRGRGAYLMKS